MIIGVPKEIKNHEYRVGMTPAGVDELVGHGHKILMQKNAGVAIGFSNADYEAAGAKIVNTAKELFAKSEMIVKVKELQKSEYSLLSANQILFTYLHLAPDLEQTKALIASKCIAIAYETVTSDSGALPLLAPMSEVAGRVSIIAGANALCKQAGGPGVLLSGTAGVKPASVVIIGGGVVGINAARMALGLNADVVILDRSLNRLTQIDQTFNGKIKTLYSNNLNISDAIKSADLVIGAVLTPGAAAPKIITRKMLKLMKKGTVIVDVSIDQGGCFETSKPTTHESPTYIVDDIIHYCVSNIPGSVARTSTLALTNATLPYILNLANNGWKKALLNDSHLKNGLNVCKGEITHQAVANALKLKYINAEKFL
ncbi:MAG: alanine dehydrogenase [Burkholderiales bacterium]|nr:alanine dehydrogenase [Burkholderiales bacterium]